MPRRDREPGLGTNGDCACERPGRRSAFRGAAPPGLTLPGSDHCSGINPRLIRPYGRWAGWRCFRHRQISPTYPPTANERVAAGLHAFSRQPDGCTQFSDICGYAGFCVKDRRTCHQHRRPGRHDLCSRIRPDASIWRPAMTGIRRGRSRRVRKFSLMSSPKAPSPRVAPSVKRPFS